MSLEDLTKNSANFNDSTRTFPIVGDGGIYFLWSDRSIFNEYEKFYNVIFNKTLNIERERSMIVSFNLVCVILSLFGNSFILYAIWKKAIRLYKITVVLIQIIAVTDLGITIFKIFPVFLTAAVDRWIFGTLFCKIQAYLYEGLFVFSLALVCLVNVTKAVTLAFPFRARTVTKRYGYVAAGVVLLISLVWMIICKLKCDGEMFEYVMMSCNWAIIEVIEPGKGMLNLLIFTFAIYLIVLEIIIIFTSCFILLKAYQLKKRSNRSINLQGVGAVLLITALFLLSTMLLLLYNVYTTILMFTDKILDPSVYSSFLSNYIFYGIGRSLSNLNSVGNFFVYLVSIKSFNLFFKECCSKLNAELHKIIRVCL